MTRWADKGYLPVSCCRAVFGGSGRSSVFWGPAFIVPGMVEFGLEESSSPNSSMPGISHPESSSPLSSFVVCWVFGRSFTPLLLFVPVYSSLPPSESSSAVLIVILFVRALLLARSGH